MKPALDVIYNLTAVSTFPAPRLIREGERSEEAFAVCRLTKASSSFLEVKPKYLTSPSALDVSAPSFHSAGVYDLTP